MVLFHLETQSDSAFIDIDTDDREKIKEILKEYLNDRNCYYVDGLLRILQEKGFNPKKVIPIKINWWEIQSVKNVDDTVKKLLED